MTDSTSFDVAHIGSVELLTPTFDKSLWFFRDLLAMRVVAEHGDSVFLRTWDEYELYTIKLTASADAGVGRTTFRAISQEALERRVAAIESTGLGEGWVDGEVGTGPTYMFRDPDGHSMGIYYETERYVAGDEDRPALKNQASAFPGRGVNARRLDHINYLAKDVEANGEFLATALGMRESERIRLNSGNFAAWWFHFSLKSYDVVYSDDWKKAGNRLHHIAFAPDTRRTSSRRRISSSRTASTSNQGRTSTPSTRPSSSTSGSPAATASSSPTREHACSSILTSPSSSGPKRSARRAKRGE